MVSNDDDIKVFHLDLPARREDIARLELGSAVYLNGVVYTAREGVYKKVLDQGLPLPVDLRAISNVNFHCSPAAAPDGRGGYNVGAVTATASFRFSKWIPRWLEETGCRILIGKGGMPADDYKQVLAPGGAIYLTTVGYGTGACWGGASSVCAKCTGWTNWALPRPCGCSRSRISGLSSSRATWKAIRSSPSTPRPSTRASRSSMPG